MVRIVDTSMFSICQYEFKSPWRCFLKKIFYIHIYRLILQIYIHEWPEMNQKYVRSWVLSYVIQEMCKLQQSRFELIIWTGVFGCDHFGRFKIREDVMFDYRPVSPNMKIAEPIMFEIVSKFSWKHGNLYKNFCMNWFSKNMLLSSTKNL